MHEKSTEFKPIMRDFQEKDLVRSVDIIYETLGKSMAKKAREDLSEGLRSKTHIYSYLKRKVFDLNGQVIALIGVYKLSTHPENLFGVCWFAVDKGYQGKGLGKELLTWAMEETRKNKKDILFVWATKEAVPFYGKFGFEESYMDLKPKETRILLAKEL
jgi:predicted N-acetyltransferase YhbS